MLASLPIRLWMLFEEPKSDRRCSALYRRLSPVRRATRDGNGRAYLWIGAAPGRREDGRFGFGCPRRFGLRRLCRRRRVRGAPRGDADGCAAYAAFRRGRRAGMGSRPGLRRKDRRLRRALRLVALAAPTL